MIKRTMFAVAATVLLAIFVAGCGDDPDVAAAKKAQTLQSIAYDMQSEADQRPLLDRVQTVGWIIIMSESASLAAVVLMGAMRRIGLGAMSETERWEMLEMGRVKIAVAQAQAVAAQHPGDVTNNYGAAIDGEWRVADDPLQLPAAPPVAPSWAALQMSGFIASPERFIIGYGTDGAITTNLASDPTTGIIGKSRRGKSTALRFYIKQSLQFGGVVVFDPAGSVIPAWGVPRVAHANSNDRGEMDALANKLDGELTERLRQYANGKRNFVYICCYFDETPRLSQLSARAINALGRLITEGGKVNMPAFIAGQGLPAAVLAMMVQRGEDGNKQGRDVGGSLFRATISTRVAFSASSDMSAMLGFNRAAGQLIDELGNAQGLCYIEGPCRLTYAAMPNVSEADLSGPLQLAQPAPVARYVPTESPKDDEPTIEERAHALYDDGASIRDVAGELNATRYQAEVWRKSWLSETSD